jgi:hypothetical protein
MRKCKNHIPQIVEKVPDDDDGGEPKKAIVCKSCGASLRLIQRKPDSKISKLKRLVRP